MILKMNKYAISTCTPMKSMVYEQCICVECFDVNKSYGWQSAKFMRMCVMFSPTQMS